ncbi:CBN-SRV-26 protein [Caenorhabditis brenneri]|uniref:CBN-SRV-26 protein n=1 Tax=Caenorhabditis brenneri TaxID=135651 RepID=G0N9Z1_CAEBE|nr:CBN-SRV-26 protein [Caenorhabditis brenneri]
MNSTLEPPTWGFKVYYAMTIVTLPIYFSILICFIRLRYVSKTYNSTFYSLLLQHCIADLTSMIGYLALTPAREIPVIRQFYFEYQQYYIAAGTFCNGYCSKTIVFSHLQHHLLHSLYQKIQKAAKWKINLVYWLTPTLLSVVVLKDTDFYFNNLVDMTVIIDRAITQRNTLMALIVVAVTCIVCSLAYGGLLYFVRKNSSIISKSLRREIHLAFQVLLLLLAFFAMLVFFAVLNYFSRMQMNEHMYYLRGLYPMASGFLSYINPYCILLLNRDLTRQVYHSFTCDGYKESEAQVSGIFSNSNKQLTLPTTQTRTGMKDARSIRRVAFR